MKNYKADRELYENLRIEYNDAVTELENIIDSAILQNSRPADDEQGILDQIFALFQGAIEPEEEEAPVLPELPPRPEAPKQPSNYDGAQISALEPVLGYGILSSGKISLRPHHGVKKFFGVSGQGQRTQENLSYTLDSTNLAGDCYFNYPDSAMRFYLLSVYPKLTANVDGTPTVWEQRAERLKFTVQSEFLNEEYDFSLPESTQSVSNPVSPPNDDKIAEYYASFEEDYVAEDGASKLYISVTASLVALAALTLY